MHVAGVLVVGAAIVRGGRVLAARRSAPESLAGYWEFPGGKVEPGEDEISALIRECDEELGVLIKPVERIGPTTPLKPGYTMRLWGATLLERDPRPLEDHDELRWLSPDGLDAVAWLPADLPLLPLVSAWMTARNT